MRTKKECSLNPHWGQIELKNVQSLGTLGDESIGDEEPNLKPQRVQTAQENLNPQLPTPMTMAGETDALRHLFQNPAQPHDSFGWDASFAMPEGAASASTGDSIGASGFDGMTPGNNNNSHLGDWEFMLAADRQPPGQIPHMGLDCFAVPSMAEYASNPSSFDGHSNSFDPRQFSAPRGSMSSSMDSPRHKKRRPSKDPRQRRDSRHWREKSSMSLSPFAAAHTAMANSNRSLISESLLRIYHDVLENNLGCWLAEDTCPYKLQNTRQEIVPAHHFDPSANMQPEWGVAWSNRMYRRVKQLDRVAQATGTIKLTRSEGQAASKALDLAIMAFATQWAQGKRRTERFDPGAWEDNSAESDFGDYGDEFEQALQQSVWEQARRALQDVSDLESFRVVYAELIFGLIQKPWTIDEYEADSVRGSVDTDGGVKASILRQVMDIIAQGGPPVFIERAARKIHALKYRVQAQEAGFQQADRLGRSACESDTFQRFSTEERRTVGLLYWMGVMFDTVSSSMNERPVVVPDEECEHDATQEIERQKTNTLILSRRWELDLYAQDNSEKPSPLHWPCPYEEATRAVARSAAVKVLLFRYVSYLQNALRKNEDSQAIEEIIQVTTSVYRYWNKTHGSFFRDLTKNYDTIPSRIKSWFPCISIPWHLGSLMLADLIEFVDENQLGLKEPSAERLDAKMAMRIRKSSSTELADLAMASTPQDMSNVNMEQLPDFHFAVNESPLLTEPWTILLIRAFTAASVYHIAVAEELRKDEWSVLGHESEELQASIRRAKSCVRALGLLGTKTAMALSISKVLSRQLWAYERDGSLDSELNQGCAV